MSEIPAVVFSPARMVYIAALTLVILDKLSLSFWGFIGLSFGFLIVEICHDDYLRIKLNKRAEKEN